MNTKQKEKIKETRLTKKEIKDIWTDVIAFMEGLRNENNIQ